MSNSPMLSQRSVLRALPAALFFGSCGGETTGPGADGNPSGDFVLAVSGDVNGTIRGDQGGFWEVTDGQTGEAVWVLSLSVGDEAAVEGIQVLVGGTRPSPGEYLISAADPDELAEGEGVAFLVVNPTLTAPGFLGISVSGSVTVTESSTEAVRGTLLISAQGNVLPPGGQAVPGLVAVDGHFEAVLTEPEISDPVGSPPIDPT